MTERIDTSYKGLLRVALPMSVGALVQFAVVFTDNYFVSLIDGDAMSAVSYVGLIYVALAMIGYGLGNATQIMVARRKGEGQLSDAGETTASAIWLGLFVAVLQVALLWGVAPRVLDHTISSPVVRAYMDEFIPFRSFGFLFYTVTIVLNSFWSGIAVTRVMIYTTLITAVVNIFLDYVLIFGIGPFPEMGVSGAALATMLSEGCALIYLLIYSISHRETRIYQLWEHLIRVPRRFMLPILRLGTPIILQLLISLGVWVVFYNFIEKLGTQSFQSSFIVRNMYMLAWVSVMGFSSTTKTMVSSLIAESRQNELVVTVRRLALMNMGGVLLLTHGLILYPHFIAEIFSNDPVTIELTVTSSYVVFPAILTFAVTSILLATVEGSGNTVAGFVIEGLTTALYVTAAYTLAVTWMKPVYIVWMADYVYFVALGVFSLLFLRKGTWKHTRV